MSSKVYIIIPVHNRKSYTENCLRCLENQTYRNKEVIIVNDGSTDGTSQMLKDKFPLTTVLDGNGELWWLGAVNLALKFVMSHGNKDDLVLLLNNDLTFNETLIEVLVHTNTKYPYSLIGSVGSRQDSPHMIINGGGIINWWIAKGKHLNVGRSLKEFPVGHIEKVSYLTGRGVLFPVRIFHEIGIFNSKYVHMGDFEYGVRANRHGYELLISYDAVVYNYPGNPKGIKKNVYRWSDLWTYFTDERSYANIRNVFLNSILCTKNPLQGMSYLLFDIIQLTGHFVKGVYFSQD